MLLTDLRTLIANGESSFVEFKRDDLQPEKLAREIVAFSNHEGGQVLLGVDDSGAVVGLQRQDLEEWVMNVCRTKIRPPLIPSFETLHDVEPGKDVAVVSVEAGYTVHALWHNSRSSYYMRVGSTTREASAEELSRLFQQRGSLRAELQPISGATVEDLDMRRLRDYFSRVRSQAVPDDEDVDGWEQLLVNTELLVGGGDGTVPTLASIVLFSLAVRRFLPHVAIDAAAYPGTEKDYQTIERAEIRRPAVALGPGSDMVEPGAVEEALAFVTRVAPARADASGGQRIERPVIPAEVLREVIVNAVVHRDYLLGSSSVELSVYADRIEVVSPGRLPNGITPAGMLVGVRAARNQLIKDVMRDYGYLEHMGMGIPRMVVAGMLAHNGTEPELIEDFDAERFTVRLWR